MDKNEVVTVPKVVWNRYRILTVYAAVVATVEIVLVFLR